MAPAYTNASKKQGALGASLLETENSPESPQLGEIKCMRKQCVPGASPFFAKKKKEKESKTPEREVK